MKRYLVLLLIPALVLVGCSSKRYVPPPTAAAVPVDPQVSMQRQISALSANMSALQAQITRNNSQITELSRLNDSLVAQIAALKKSTTNVSSPAAPVSPADVLTRLAAVEAKATAVDANEKNLDATTKAGLKAASDDLNNRIASLSNQTGLLYASKSDVAGWQNYMTQLDSRLQAVEKKLGLR